MKKNIRNVIIAIVCVAAVVGGFYWVTQREADKTADEVELTEVQKVITKDIEENYPATPREVVKTYNRIICCFYNEEYTEQELYALGDQARLLFDEELLENNPRDIYFEDLKADIADYEANERTIASTSVSSSNDVEFKTIDGRECAYVETAYFIKEGNSFNRTYQMYLLRKDEDGNWKIVAFQKIKGDSSDDE